MSLSARFWVDKITNSIEEGSTGISHKTEIALLRVDDIGFIHRKNGWFFNWEEEYKKTKRHVFKLTLDKDKLIQGLISLEPFENYIEMHLIESAPHNYGTTKRFIGVPANLVAFACKLSFDSGFEGFVGFTAKTNLIHHYIEALGAELIFRNRMSISGNSAKN